MKWFSEEWHRFHTWMVGLCTSVLTAGTLAYDQLSVLQNALGANLFHKAQAVLAVLAVVSHVSKNLPKDTPKDDPK